jgi:hypothetical protein
MNQVFYTIAFFALLCTAVGILTRDVHQTMIQEVQSNHIFDDNE